MRKFTAILLIALAISAQYIVKELPIETIVIYDSDGLTTEITTTEMANTISVILLSIAILYILAISTKTEITKLPKPDKEPKYGKLKIPDDESYEIYDEIPVKEQEHGFKVTGKKPGEGNI